MKLKPKPMQPAGDPIGPEIRERCEALQNKIVLYMFSTGYKHICSERRPDELDPPHVWWKLIGDRTFQSWTSDLHASDLPAIPDLTVSFADEYDENGEPLPEAS